MPSSLHPPLNTLATRWAACKGDVPPPLVGAAAVVVDEDYQRHTPSSSRGSYKGKLFLFAGRLAANRRMTNDLYCLDLETLSWAKVPIAAPLQPSLEQDTPELKLLEKAPTPRYFHSCDLWRGKLVIFGGMGFQSQSSRSEAATVAAEGPIRDRKREKSGDPLFVMDEILLFDLATMRWDYDYITRPGPVRGPAPRYAHLSAITGDCLVVIGGQNINNKYIEEINVFDLVKRQWTLCETLARQCGSYRSLSVSSPWIIEGQVRGPTLMEAIAATKRSASKGSLSTNLPSPNVYPPSAMGRSRGLSNVSSTGPYEMTPDTASLRSVKSAESAQDSLRPSTYEETPATKLTVSSGVSQASGGANAENKQTEAHSAPLPMQTLPTSRPIMKHDENPPLYVYSNYNFTDVKRELEVIKLSKTREKNGHPKPKDEYHELPSLTIEDHSSSMQGGLAAAGLPPGLRFPTGVIVGDYLLVSGTYLANTSQAFSVWSLYIPKLIWSRLDIGPLISRGSWNRAVVSLKRSQMFILGHRERDLVEDYNHRQSNWDHMLTLDLEAWGICQPPTQPTSAEGIGLGLRKLETAMASTIYQQAAAAFARRRSVLRSNAASILDSKAWCGTLAEEQRGLALLPDVFGTGGDFEIVCSDSLSIGCDRVILETRWPWFRQRLERYRKQAKAAADLAQQRKLERRTHNQANASQMGNRDRSSSKERAVAALRTAASEEDSELQFFAAITDDMRGQGASAGKWRLTPRQLYLSEPSTVVLALLQFFYTQCICTSLQRHPSTVASLLLISRLYDLEDTLGRWARHAADVLLRCDLTPDVFNVPASSTDYVPTNPSRSGDATAVSIATSGTSTASESGGDLSLEECHRLCVLLCEAAGMAGYDALQVRAMRNVVALNKIMQRLPQTRPQEQQSHGRSDSQGNRGNQVHGVVGQQLSSSVGNTLRRPGEPIRANASGPVPLKSSGLSLLRNVRPNSSADSGSGAGFMRHLGANVDYRPSSPIAGRGGAPIRPTSSSSRLDASLLNSEDAEYISTQHVPSEGGSGFARLMARPRSNSKADRILGMTGDTPSVREEGGPTSSRKNTVSSITSVGSNGSTKGDGVPRQGGGNPVNLSGAGGGRKRFSLFGRGGSLAAEELSERDDSASLTSKPLSRGATSGSTRGSASNEAGGPPPSRVLYDSPIDANPITSLSP